jgi:hypothetical protein
MTIALNLGLENLRQLSLKFGQDVLHLFVNWVLLELHLSQLDVLYVRFNMHSSPAAPFLC